MAAFELTNPVMLHTPYADWLSRQVCWVDPQYPAAEQQSPKVEPLQTSPPEYPQVPSRDIDPGVCVGLAVVVGVDVVVVDEPHGPLWHPVPQ
ncbi:Uu.00g117530.m01.CDS01 [Anthostomella pinea]|uniref:Uu.00g117530.m01.CDS01 n=1 Tax=Anthostomella pinea TaxID=933095 RepID=A0AAI8VH99_9PEZI|nr:Uu.00g117530.m01.CDS01 [Anthostomella pinea]